MLPTVSYHLWKPCNMRCKFCYATFDDIPRHELPKGHQTKEECFAMLKMFADAGIQKVTFAGGEPMLCGWLDELIIYAKSLGMTTSIITNGSYLTQEFMDRVGTNLDWIGISIDSLNPEINLAHGRAITGKKPIDELWYLDLIDLVKKNGYKFKLNTVVTSLNWAEDMNSFISAANPDRWKVFQVLPMDKQGQNIEQLEIFDWQFKRFLHNHKDQPSLVPEDNETMRSSYLLVSPDGRFFEGTEGHYTYSRKIAEVGMEEAFKDINLDIEMFHKRGGVYNW